MNVLAIILQEAEAAQEQPGLFDLNLGVSFWTIVIFLLLLWALAKFAFPAILGYAQAREDRIRELMESAQRDRDEAQRLLEEQKRQLASTRDEASRIIAEAKQAAESVRQEVVEKAHVEQQEMLERARDEIEREREKAVDAIRMEAVDLAIAAAGQLLGQKVHGEADRRFVQDVISRTGTGAA